MMSRLPSAALMILSFGMFAYPLGAAADLSLYDSPGFLRLEAEAGSVTGATIRTDQQNASGGACLFIDNPGQSTAWSDVELTPGTYRVTLGCKSPWGGETAKKLANVTINGGTRVVELPNSAYFSSVNLGNFELSAHNSVSISDNWTWYFIDWIQFVRVDAACDDLGATRARRLLNLLVANRGKTVVSGQQEPSSADVIRQKTGFLPALICTDFLGYDSVAVNNSGYSEVLTEDLIRYWEEGYLISKSWHWHSPSGWREEGDDHWWNSFYTEHTSFDLAGALADKNGADFKLLLADIDLIAMELKKFADADVPVLWRPLHEAEGNQWGAWFWWGADGAASFKELWHILHDRLENVHGLHNLIWVYSCTDDMSPDWYPGDDYVDIVAVDEYPADRTTTLKDAWNRMNASFGHTNKPFALSEFGGLPDIPAMMADGVNWIYFASWTGTDYGPEGMDEAALSRVYSSGKVVTALELDQDGDGVTNGVCTLLGLPTQRRLTPCLGLDTGSEITPVPLFPEGYEHDASLGNLFECGSGLPVLLGKSFHLRKSGDLSVWEDGAPASIQNGGDGHILLVVPFSGTSPAFFRLESTLSAQ